MPRIFGSVNDALYFLLHEWPGPKGRAHSSAVRGCGLSIDSGSPTAIARGEFEIACIKAGMYPIGYRKGPPKR